MSVVPTDPPLTPGQQLVAQIRSQEFRSQVSLALPEDVRPERFVRAVVTALMASPDLQDAEPNSILNAALRAAQDGLLPDNREAALVIYNTKVKVNGQDTWVKKAQYLPMIAGLRKIAAEHGWSIRTTVVYEHDHFEWEAEPPRIVHRPVRPGEERGRMIAAYAVGVHRDGRRSDPEVMYPQDIEKRRQASKAKDSGPWRDWPERMWEKTVGKALFERLALDPNDKRVASMLADGNGSHDPVRSLYGPPQQRRELIEGEIPPGEAAPGSRERAALPPAGAATPEPGSPGDSTAGEDGAGQQAGEATEGTGAGDSPAPDTETPADDPEPQLALDQQQTPKPGLKDARAIVLQSGMYQGKALGEIAKTDGCITWFQWALRNPGSFDEPTFAAIEVVAEKDVVDAWNEHIEKRAKA